jgi:hypothetical protein
VGIETEPVHATRVACVLDFETAIHDHGEAALFRDSRALRLITVELSP